MTEKKLVTFFNIPSYKISKANPRSLTPHKLEPKPTRRWILSSKDTSKRTSFKKRSTVWFRLFSFRPKTLKTFRVSSNASTPTMMGSWAGMNSWSVCKLKMMVKRIGFLIRSILMAASWSTISNLRRLQSRKIQRSLTNISKLRLIYLTRTRTAYFVSRSWCKPFKPRKKTRNDSWKLLRKLTKTTTKRFR